MNIDKYTIGEIKEITSLLPGLAHNQGTSFSIGEKYLIRTVTMMYTGKLIRITETDLLLEDAAWIADSGRYSKALKNGTLNEVEPYPDQVIVGRNGIIDAALWMHPLPRDVK